MNMDNTPGIIISRETGIPMEASTSLELPIPTQQIESIEGDEDLVALVTIGIVIQVVVAITLSASFKFLWAMLHTV
jgi:hypothetical protein